MPKWTETARGYLKGLADAVVPPVRRLSLPEVRHVEAAYGPDSIKVAEALDEAATGYVKHGQRARAETVLRRSIEIKEAHHVPDPGDLALTLARLARVVADPSGAEALYLRSISVYDATPESDRLGFASALNGLGRLLFEQSRLPEAEPLLRRSIAVYHDALGRGDHRLVEPLLDLASVLMKESREQEAESLLRRAAAIHEKQEGRGPYNRALSLLVNLLERQRRSDEATRLAEGLRYDEGAPRA